MATNTPEKTKKDAKHAPEIKQASGFKKYVIIGLLLFMTVGFTKSLYDFRQEAKNYDLQLRSLNDFWWIALFSLINLVTNFLGYSN
jgi:hypothetical protein